MFWKQIDPILRQYQTEAGNKFKLALESLIIGYNLKQMIYCTFCAGDYTVTNKQLALQKGLLNCVSQTHQNKAYI